MANRIQDRIKWTYHSQAALRTALLGCPNNPYKALKVIDYVAPDDYFENPKQPLTERLFVIPMERQNKKERFVAALDNLGYPRGCEAEDWQEVIEVLQSLDQL